MYTSKKISTTDSQQVKYKFYQNSQQLNYDNFLNGLCQDANFRSFFINLLNDVPFKAYHWETPAVKQSTVEQPFEFVVSNAPGIDLPPNYGPFQQYFESANEAVTVFDNLGGDAKLIAPKPPGKRKNYSHIGRFTQNASSEEQHALWKRVGQVVEKQISDKPLWLNTAGGGVAWLHVRLDSRPKYYRHQPYCV